MIDKIIVYLWFFMSIMLIVARKLVYQAKKDNRIMDVGNLQPGTLVIVKVEEARNQ